MKLAPLAKANKTAPTLPLSPKLENKPITSYAAKIIDKTIHPKHHFPFKESMNPEIIAKTPTINSATKMKTTKSTTASTTSPYPEPAISLATSRARNIVGILMSVGIAKRTIAMIVVINTPLAYLLVIILKPPLSKSIDLFYEKLLAISIHFDFDFEYKKGLL